MNTYEKIRLLAGKMGLSQDPDIRRMYAEQIAKLQGNENTLEEDVDDHITKTHGKGWRAHALGDHQDKKTGKWHTKYIAYHDSDKDMTNPRKGIYKSKK